MSFGVLLLETKITTVFWFICSCVLKISKPYRLYHTSNSSRETWHGFVSGCHSLSVSGRWCRCCAVWRTECQSNMKSIVFLPLFLRYKLLQCMPQRIHHSWIVFLSKSFLQQEKCAQWFWLKTETVYKNTPLVYPTCTLRLKHFCICQVYIITFVCDLYVNTIHIFITNGTCSLRKHISTYLHL